MAERKAFLLRIDPALWEELERWAAEELRSANGQIEWVLKQAVARRKGGALSAVGARPPASAPPTTGEG